MAVTTAAAAAIPFAGAAATRGDRRRRTHSCLAFLPFGDTYILGDLLDALRILHGALILPLLHRHGELLFHFLTVYRTRVIGAEGVYQAVRGGVMNNAALHTLHFVIIGVHEVHATSHEQLVAL